ncbi:hypothetical protein J6590_031392 [Homalodisca vitripennis]|nr:hypothetical protein J6590_031392 [Homalodisca vitripennis]
MPQKVNQNLNNLSLHIALIMIPNLSQRSEFGRVSASYVKLEISLPVGSVVTEGALEGRFLATMVGLVVPKRASPLEPTATLANPVPLQSCQQTSSNRTLISASTLT